MRKFVLIPLLALVSSLLSVLLISPAEAATRCWENGGQYPRCATVTSTSRKLRAIETISFTNRTGRTQNYHCTFTTTLSRAVTYGGSLTAEAKFKVFEVVEATVSVTVHRSVTQTAEQASAAAFSGKVAPGQTIYCDRMYGYVSARVKIYQNYTDGPDYNNVRTVTTPINLGIRVRKG